VLLVSSIVIACGEDRYCGDVAIAFPCDVPEIREVGPITPTLDCPEGARGRDQPRACSFAAEVVLENVGTAAGTVDTCWFAGVVEIHRRYYRYETGTFPVELVGPPVILEPGARRAATFRWTVHPKCENQTVYILRRLRNWVAGCGLHA
jgi:hypothetical protein